MKAEEAVQLRVDPARLMHWMNARKLTTVQAAERAQIDPDELDGAVAGTNELDAAALERLCGALRVDPGQVVGSDHSAADVVVQDAEGFRASRRPIQRDGIPFYNYYSLAAPDGKVAPVVLDILCPADRLPALNNGHLEPAITVNLGPGPIHGRWGEELTETTWQVLDANPDPTLGWVCGDTYVEPPFCRHSYSLASERPARIVSYTAESNLAPLVDEVNHWPDESAASLFAGSGEGVTPQVILDAVLARRSHDRRSACLSAEVSEDRLADALSQPHGPEALEVLRAIAAAVGLDYRVLLPAQPDHDDAGKTSRAWQQALSRRRRFGGHEVAPMAAATAYPDLVGTFLRVDEDESLRDAGQLPGFASDHGQTHYFVLNGAPVLDWTTDGRPGAAALDADGSAWVPPYVPHRWRGKGAVLRFGSGGQLGYLDWLELTNTFQPERTLRAARRNLDGWGYDAGPAR